MGDTGPARRGEGSPGEQFDAAMGAAMGMDAAEAAEPRIGTPRFTEDGAIEVYDGHGWKVRFSGPDDAAELAMRGDPETDDLGFRPDD